MRAPNAVGSKHGALLGGLLVAVALVACGGAPERDEAAERAEGATSGRERPVEAAPPDDPRRLGAEGTFGDLLRAARTLDDRRDQGSDAGCLLRRPGAGTGWRLEADLAVAVRPLRDAPDDLDERLVADGAPVDVLTRWGALGPGEPIHPTFAAVTTTLPPQRPAAQVWAVTDRGVYVRSTEVPVDRTTPMTPEEAARALGAVGARGSLFVSAEAGVPLSRLAEVLGRVPGAFAGRVGLAVALEPGTRLPEPPAPETARGAALCPDGLPPLPDDAAVGALAPEAIVARLGPLRQGAAICVGTTGGPGAAGGRVTLALRIGPDGTVEEACAVRDEADDPALRACLAEAARSTAFAAPDPSGYVDVQLPLVLAPVESQRQRPLCAP
jgi:hypothetical protein